MCSKVPALRELIICGGDGGKPINKKTQSTECHEEMKPENRVERDAGAVLRGRDPEGLSEEVMLKCKGPRWEEAQGCEEELRNQRGRGEGGRGRAGGNEVRKLGCAQSL